MINKTVTRLFKHSKTKNEWYYIDMSLKKNILGRVYQHGIGLSVDLRSLIIQDLIENGRNCVTGKVSRGVFFPCCKEIQCAC